MGRQTVLEQNEHPFHGRHGLSRLVVQLARLARALFHLALRHDEGQQNELGADRSPAFHGNKGERLTVIGIATRLL
jgi:hypothetical protein